MGLRFQYSIPNWVQKSVNAPANNSTLVHRLSEEYDGMLENVWLWHIPCMVWPRIVCGCNRSKRSWGICLLFHLLSSIIVSLYHFFVLIKLCFGCLLYQIILSSVKHIDKMNDYRFLHPWLGNGLITSTGMNKITTKKEPVSTFQWPTKKQKLFHLFAFIGQIWHKHRKMITPSFHFNILNIFHTSINKGANLLAKKLEKLNVENKGAAMDIQDLINLSTLDIICGSFHFITFFYNGIVEKKLQCDIFHCRHGDGSRGQCIGQSRFEHSWCISWVKSILYFSNTNRIFINTHKVCPNNGIKFYY